MDETAGQGVVASVAAHIEHLRSVEGGLDTRREALAAVALTLAAELDAGDSGKGPPRTSGLAKELRSTLEELEPKGVEDDGDPDPAWVNSVRTTVQHPA